MGEERSRVFYTEAEFAALFEGPKRNKALDIAHDTRKFEIELYWKRAAYFWTIIAATFIGFGASQQLSDKAVRTDMSVVVACLGTVFSFAWFCINKGNKYWQTNWEKDVEMLEDDLSGPLYKLNWLPGPERASWIRRALWVLNEGGRFSVTRINQLVSFFVFLFWVLLLCHVLPINPKWPINLFYCFLILLTVCALFAIVVLGKSGRGRPHTRFKLRGGKPEPPSDGPL